MPDRAHDELRAWLADVYGGLTAELRKIQAELKESELNARTESGRRSIRRDASADFSILARRFEEARETLPEEMLDTETMQMLRVWAGSLYAYCVMRAQSLSGQIYGQRQVTPQTRLLSQANRAFERATPAIRAALGQSGPDGAGAETGPPPVSGTEARIGESDPATR